MGQTCSRVLPNAGDSSDAEQDHVVMDAQRKVSDQVSSGALGG